MMLLLALIAVSSVYGTTCDGLAHVAAKANAVSAQIVSNTFYETKCKSKFTKKIAFCTNVSTHLDLAPAAKYATCTFTCLLMPEIS